MNSNGEKNGTDSADLENLKAKSDFSKLYTKNRFCNHKHVTEWQQCKSNVYMEGNLILGPNPDALSLDT